MSIKKSRAKYVGGYDKEYYIDAMSNSHIINSLVQIKQKIEAVEAQIEAGNNVEGGLIASIKCLANDGHALAAELDSRDNCSECC